jgi:uncharacterized membrane protein
MMETVSGPSVYLTIGLAAAVTYLLRIGGLMLAGRFPSSGRIKLFMDALPGTVLISLIAPGIASAGLCGVIGALVTATCAYRTGNLLLSMLAGVIPVAVMRYFGLAPG